MSDDDISPSPWWSIPQALVWIVTRSEAQVLRAGGLTTIARVQRMTGLRRSSNQQEPPPVTLADASDELIRAWRTRRITLHGREWAEGPSRSIPARNDVVLRDHRGQVCLGARTLYFDAHSFWSSLHVRAKDCKRRWPSPLERTSAGAQPLTAARRPSNSDVLAFIEEQQKSLRAEQKRAGRDVLLKAAMNHFGLSYKVVLDIWSRVTRDHKGGRPMKTKPGATG
jgi:hypothetical protein